MADLELQIEGLADLERKLLALGGAAAPRSLNKGLRAGANVVLKEARRRVRKKTGDTARKTKVVSQGVQGGESTQSVTTNFVGRFLELGTSKMQPYPFLRPAMAAKAVEAVEAARDVTLSAIEQEALKA